MSDWQSVSARPQKVTVVVHGYNVDEAGGQDFTTRMFKRFYWTELPVLFEPQENAAQPQPMTMRTPQP